MLARLSDGVVGRTKHDISEDGVHGHLDVADGDTETQDLDNVMSNEAIVVMYMAHLLQLELDG